MKVKLQPPDARFPTCFGMHYTGFFKFFVFCNLIQNVIFIALVANDIVIVMMALQVVTLEPFDERVKLYLRAIAWCWTSAQSITSFITDIKLLLTAASPCTHFLRFYALLHAISLTLYCIWYYSLLTFGTRILPYPSLLITVLLPGYTLYRIYTSYVVFRYSKDIEWEQEMKSAYRCLTESEVTGFEIGLVELEGEFGKLKMQEKILGTCYEMARFEKYRRAEFEIPRESLDFSDSSTLGCGEYGCVYKAVWVRKDDKVEVAVKTVNPELSDVNHFKALLTEAKVMTLMGRHENIVELIGFCTANIRQRELYIVCELCQFGNLLEHLRSGRNMFVNEMPGSGNDFLITVSHQSPSIGNSLRTRDLVKWAGEIASGMGYLSSKKIIHGDLSTRNVLLTSHKTAKITDFGLSRRLYNYSVYTKRQNMPLPWRWLALESLVDMEFSSMSDVWMYGICLWEIFQLGLRPWPDVQLFCSDFIEDLKEGKRMGKPKYCDNDIFDIMLSCWMQDPNDRPKFSQLRDYFKDRLKSVYCVG